MVSRADSDIDESARTHMEERVGRTLCNKYTLEKLIGIGGMASVYRGSHRNGNRVAIKVLHTELCVSKDIRERFLREGYVANRVDHPGAVRVLDDDIAEDGSVFLVMELLEGETLEQHIVDAGGVLAPVELAPFACQLLDVLAAAHDKGIVHRDIKPENLFIGRDRSLKVLDFGIARLNDSARQATRTGRVLGTPVYMAPEQARGETKLVDGQTDLWATGAIMFRALTGRYVHEADTPEMVMIYAATRASPRLRDLLPMVNPQLGEIVDRALTSSKGGRWKSAQAMATALRSLRTDDLTNERSSARAEVNPLGATQPLAGKGATAPIPAPLVRADNADIGPGLPDFDADDELPTLATSDALQTAAAVAAVEPAREVSRPVAARGATSVAGTANTNALDRARVPPRSLRTTAFFALLGVMLVASMAAAAISIIPHFTSRASTSGGAAVSAPLGGSAGAVPESAALATDPLASPSLSGPSAASSSVSETVPATAVSNLPNSAGAGGPAVANGVVRRPVSQPQEAAAPVGAGVPVADAGVPKVVSVVSPAGAPHCDPPFTVSASGAKQWKLECFKK